MAVKQITPMGEVRKYIDEQLNRRKMAIINAISYVAETCLRAAREIDTYKDRTANLRSSTGYAIIVDGRVFKKSSFAKESSQGEQHPGTVYDGAEKGSAFLDDLIGDFPTGIALIMVAGMNYAAYVQDYGYDVLDCSELLADRLVPQILKQLGLQ